jgi:simple sugar transport system permease protein
MEASMTATTSAGPAPAPERLRQISLAQRLLARPAAGALVIVVFVFIVFSVLSLARGSTAFLSIPGVLNYVGVASQVGIIATSVALLMIAGEFDLSVGSLVGFAGIMIGIGSTIWGLPIWLSILISMALTTGLGVLNGLIVVRTGLPSFIVTLATMFIIAGLSSVLVLGLTNITFISINKTLIDADPLAAFFNWKLSLKFDQATSDLYVSVVWWIAIAAIGAYVLGRRKFGNWIAGVGGSPNAARNLGVPVSRVKITLFASTAFSASILAACQSMQFASADIQRGAGYELTAITMAVIGGCLLTGGYGSVAGTALGALALGMANIGIVYASINADWYKIAIGVLLLSAVVLNNWIRRRFAGLR